MSRRGPNEGSIHQRASDGRWAGSVHLGYENGKRVRKHVLGHSRKEVAEKLDALVRAHREHRPIPDQRLKVGPFLQQWLEEVARPRVRRTTHESYRDIVTLHLVPELGRVSLAKLSPAEVQAMLNRKREAGLSPRRVRMILQVLDNALKTAERWGMVTRNVAKLVDGPRQERHEIAPLDEEGARRLIDSSVDHRFHALWVTALATGMRQGELLGLRWEDVDLDAGWAMVRHTLARIDGRLALVEPKTVRSRRRVPLPAMAVTALRGHRTRQRMERLVAGSRWTDSGHVFTTSIGTPLEAGRVSRAFHAALAKAGLPSIRFHDMRHTSATLLLAQGMTLEDVKQQLGHSSISLTSNTYSHVLERRQRVVAAAMDAVLGR